jgi:hypothetical protein
VSRRLVRFVYTPRAPGSSYYKHSSSIHVRTGPSVIHVECIWINLQISLVLGPRCGTQDGFYLVCTSSLLKHSSVYTCGENRTHFHGRSVCLDNSRCVTSSIPGICFRTGIKQKSHVFCTSNVVCVCVCAHLRVTARATCVRVRNARNV